VWAKEAPVRLVRSEDDAPVPAQGSSGQRAKPDPITIICESIERQTVALEKIAGAIAGIGGMLPTVAATQPTPDGGVAFRIGTPEPAGTPIADALAGWRVEMESRGCKENSIRRMAFVVRSLCRSQRWGGVEALTYTGAMTFLASQRTPEDGTKGWSKATMNQAISTLKCFGAYCRRAKLLKASPFEDLMGVKAAAEPGSRAESVENVRKLLVASINRHLRDRRAKGAAGLVWYFLVCTGMRVGSLGRLEGNGKARRRVGIRWRDIDLERATYTTDPSWFKGGRRLVRPLYGPLVAMLKDWKEHLAAGPDDFVFPILPPRATFRMDKEAAGIPERDIMGMPFSIHGLRQSFSVWLDEAGVPAGARSALMTHADTLCEAKYTHYELGKLRAELAKLPDCWPDGMRVIPTRRLINDSSTAHRRPSETGGGTNRPTNTYPHEKGLDCNGANSRYTAYVTPASIPILQPQTPGSLSPAGVTTKGPESPASVAASLSQIAKMPPLMPIASSETANTLDLAVRALAEYVLSRSGSKSEPDHGNLRAS
jgi:integrase